MKFPREKSLPRYIRHRIFLRIAISFSPPTTSPSGSLANNYESRKTGELLKFHSNPCNRPRNARAGWYIARRCIVPLILRLIISLCEFIPCWLRIPRIFMLLARTRSLKNEKIPNALSELISQRPSRSRGSIRCGWNRLENSYFVMEIKIHVTSGWNEDKNDFSSNTFPLPVASTCCINYIHCPGKVKNRVKIKRIVVMTKVLAVHRTGYV